MYRKWTTGLLKYQQYMLTTCDVGAGGGGGGGGQSGECDTMPCITPIPLDMAAYGKLLIQRQGLIQWQGRPKAYHRQIDRPVGSN